MNISIHGLGYVGCVSVGCLAKNGHKITGVDLNQEKVDFINQGKSPIIENGIEDLIFEQYESGNISATNDSREAVMNSEVSFVCVGTPSSSEGHLDLNAIFKVSEDIGKGIIDNDSYHVVVIRSTVLPGTNEKVAKIIEEVSRKENNRDFAVVSNPEFLREGTAIEDYHNPPYTLLGSNNIKAIEKVKTVYDGLDAPIIVTDVKVAEFLKYVNNAFHALKVTFANEIGNICKKLGIDSHKVMEIFCMDRKLNISSYYLKSGFAYGGSCLPKDLRALRTIAHDYYIECPVLENIEKSNELQRKYAYGQILDFGKEKVGFLGLSFKSGTDDLRNSPIIDIIEQLLGKGFNIKIYDKNVHFSQLVGANKEYILKKIPFISKFVTDDANKIIDDSDVIVVVNKDEIFCDLLNKVPVDKIIFDLVNIDFKDKEKRKNYVGIAW